MKAIVLCAGMAKRLYPLTVTMPKHLIPIANKPILFYGLEAIRDAGIHEVAIVVGGTRKDIEEAVGTGKQWDLKVTYIPQENPQGLAHAVKISKDFLKDDSFVMYLGDNLLKEGLSSFTQNFSQTLKFLDSKPIQSVQNPNRLLDIHRSDSSSEITGKRRSKDIAIQKS